MIVVNAKSRVLFNLNHNSFLVYAHAQLLQMMIATQ